MHYYIVYETSSFFTPRPTHAQKLKFQCDPRTCAPCNCRSRERFRNFCSWKQTGPGTYIPRNSSSQEFMP